MALGIKQEWEEQTSPAKPEKKVAVKSERTEASSKGMGSRRIFSPQFKLKVLDSYRQDSDCRGNQRATARKYGIHRRQIQKWLQMEDTLRSCIESVGSESSALNLSSGRQRDVASPSVTAGCLLNQGPSPLVEPEPLIDVDRISDTEGDDEDEEDYDDVSSTDSMCTNRALDFTCAALSKRRVFTREFKIMVLDAFYSEPSCSGNQRATARKFGIHRRQVQKWLTLESFIRGDGVCLDLSRKRKMEEPELPEAKRASPVWCPLTPEEVSTSVQETALCLVKPRGDAPSLSPEVTSSMDYYHHYPTPPPPPLTTCYLSPTELPTYEHNTWASVYYPATPTAYTYTIDPKLAVTCRSSPIHHSVNWYSHNTILHEHGPSNIRIYDISYR